MSRVGAQPINISGIAFKLINDQSFSFKVGGEEHIYNIPLTLKIEHSGDVISIKNVEDKASLKSKERANISKMMGLHRSIINNIVLGSKKPFMKVVKLRGVGFKADFSERHGMRFLTILVGFSHAIRFIVPKGININILKTVNSEASFEVSGVCKEAVGLFCGRVKSVRPAEPYKGRGVEIVGEFVLRKEGKTKGKK